MSGNFSLGFTNDATPVNGALKTMYRVNLPNEPHGDRQHDHVHGLCHVGWKLVEPDGTTIELCLEPDQVRGIAATLLDYANKADAMHKLLRDGS